MAYTPDYTESDLSSGIIDLIVKIILAVGIFTTLIVLILIFKYLKKKVR